MFNEKPDRHGNGGAALVRRDAYDPFLALQAEMDRAFDRAARGFFDIAPFGVPADGFSPQLDVAEDDASIVVTAELPGVDEKDVRVSLSRDSLTIQGEKKSEREEKGRGWAHVERSYGAFQRVVALPLPVNAGKAEASFKNGVLTITLPKTEEARRTVRTITVKKDRPVPRPHRRGET